MFGYTGKYNGKLISVMGSGMGMASLGIYAYELYSFYGVENIVRIGSAGAYSKDLAVYDTVLIKDAWSESTFAKVAFGYEEDVLSSNDELNKYLHSQAKKLRIELKEGRAHSSDVFYHPNPNFSWQSVRDEHGCGAVEMESLHCLQLQNILINVLHAYLQFLIHLLPMRLQLQKNVKIHSQI